MIRILFLAANPVDQARLRQGPEYSAIYNALDPARFALIPAFAATPDQLQELLFQHRPQIVHFSGHGDNTGLLFEDANGQSTPVAPETLRDLFTHFADRLHCIVLNACYSQPHAATIATVVDAVVGMGDAVSDDGALAFAEAFYRGLSNDKSLSAAVDLGRNQIDLTGVAEVDYPQLQAELVDATQLFARDWDDETNTLSATPRGIHGLYPFNKHFFGRDDELVTLHDLLQHEPNVSICPTITGMGGLGKTQLAAHYARAHVDDYRDGIFWLTAADLNNIRPQLADFCVALNLPVADPQRTGDLTEQKISAFKAYLDQHPHALLIFDNVEEPDHLRTRQIGIGFTALTLGGKVLVTTRRRKLPSDRFSELPLERLLPEPARQILITARPNLAGDPDLDRLCAQFGYLPLMLNLAAAALKKRGGAIAGYLQKLQEWGIDTLHDRAKVSLADYHTSLTAVLQEQWAMLTSEDARLLLRIAGQLPEAEVIPTARLGLLAGLQDVDEWECPLRDGLEELESASLIEAVDGVTLRLHPLVRDFVSTLSSAEEVHTLRTTCAQRLADAYCNGIEGLKRLGYEYEQRGIAELILDLLTAIELCNNNRPHSAIHSISALAIQPANNNLLTSLYDIVHHLRREAHHLHDPRERRQAIDLWQQLLLSTSGTSLSEYVEALRQLLRPMLHWLPRWGHHSQSWALEQTFPGLGWHPDGVSRIDDEHIVSVFGADTLVVLNLQSGETEQVFRCHEFNGPEYSVTGMAVIDASRIVSALEDGTLIVWNLQSQGVDQTLAGQGPIYGVTVVDSNHVVSVSKDGTLIVWDLQTRQVKRIPNGHEDRVRGMAVVDANRIVSASDDCTLKVWNLKTGQVKQTLVGHERCVRSVAVVNANQIVSASDDRTLKIWNLETGQVEQTLVGHARCVRSVAVVNAIRIVSASDDCTLKIWNLETGQVEQTLIGHERSVNSVAVVDSNRIVSASDDCTLKVWNLQSRQGAQWEDKRGDDHIVTNHQGSVNSVAVVDANRIVSASDDHTLKVWDLQNGEVMYTLNGHESSVKVVSVVNTTHIVSASLDRTFRVWDLQSKQVEKTLESRSEGNHARNSPVWSFLNMAVTDAKHIVDGTLKVWDLDTGQVEQTLGNHDGWSHCVAVLDTIHIVLASLFSTLEVWNLDTNQVKRTPIGQGGIIDLAVVDANCIVSVTKDRTLKVWNLQTGQVIATIGLDGAPQCVAVTRQDDRTLVVAGDAGGALYCLELVEPVGQ